MNKSRDQKVCLTIAGLDPSGGAGVITDVKTFSAFGCFAAAAVTSITFQNTAGVLGAVAQEPSVVRRQIDPIFDDLEVAAVKTGMLPNAGVIEEVAAILAERRVEHLVVDPVVRSTSGYDLIDDDALRSLVATLFPLATVVTPNLAEAERISGVTIRGPAEMILAARMMIDKGAANVLIKGGHMPDGDIARDYLFSRDGVLEEFEAPYLNTGSTHGSGCTLAAAITAAMALGDDLAEAVAEAKEFVHEAIRTARPLGKGHSPVNIP